MPELMMRDVDLLGIQTILALALVFENACDLQPARALAASAVTISHRMYLHSRDATEYYNIEETQERSRVFWVLYVLDKVRHRLLRRAPGFNPPSAKAENGIGSVYADKNTTDAVRFRN